MGTIPQMEIEAIDWTRVQRGKLKKWKFLADEEELGRVVEWV